MKRLFILMAIMLLAVSCGKSKTLVAYFSATGTTKAVAERIAAEAKADLFEITPEALYTEADLDWRTMESRSSVEMKDKTSRPAVAQKLKNLKQYDVVYIGFPIWWNTAPRIINTFIEENDLTGKTVKFFATSGSSSIDNSCKEFKEDYPELNWAEGTLLNNASDEDIKNFVK